MSFFLQVTKLLTVKLSHEDYYQLIVALSYVADATLEDYVDAMNIVDKACFDGNVLMERKTYEKMHGIVWSFDNLVAMQKDNIPLDGRKFYPSENLWKSVTAPPTEQLEIICRSDSNVGKILQEAMATDFMQSKKGFVLRRAI